MKSTRSQITRAFALALFATLFAFTATAGAANPTADVVGGDDAAIGDWPFMAAILESGDPDSQYCGGALVRQQWVLTTATCAYLPGASDVMVGRTDLHGLTGSVISVSDIYVFPRFETEYLTNNLALLRLESPAPAPAAPITVVDDHQSIPTGGDVLTAGWGDAVGDGTGLVDELQDVTLKKQLFCPSSGFCAGYSTADEDDSPRSVCFGDEGAPAVHDFGSGLRLAGIANELWSDCDADTTLNAFVDLGDWGAGDWIDDQIEYALHFVTEPIDFGDVDFGSGGAIRTVTVQNVGSTTHDPGTPYYRADGERGSTSHVVYDGCSGKPLAPSATCSFGLQFTPDRLGVDTGSIFMAAPGSTAGEAAELPVRANVVGDDRLGSYLGPYVVPRPKAAPGTKRKRQTSARVTVNVPADGYRAGQRVSNCSGTVKISFKLPGAKKTKSKTLGVSASKTKQGGTLCVASFKIGLPKKPNKISVMATFEFSGNTDFKPASTKLQLKLRK
jgi:secreted trypsin-like serine protease